jgi:hypothetical protein
VRVRKYLVIADVDQENYVCICARFQKDGILCEHVLRTLIQINKYSLPKKYFIQRWRLVEKEQVRNENAFISSDLSSDNSNLRYNLLSKQCVSLSSDGCLSLERTNYLMSELQRVHLEMKKIPVR